MVVAEDITYVSDTSGIEVADDIDVVADTAAVVNDVVSGAGVVGSGGSNGWNLLLSRSCSVSLHWFSLSIKHNSDGGLSVAVAISNAFDVDRATFDANTPSTCPATLRIGESLLPNLKGPPMAIGLYHNDN